MGVKWDFYLQKFFLKNEKRYLSFSEVMNLSFEGDTTQRLKDLNIELVENTADEICDVTVEMDDRLNGTWVDENEDEELQQCFWSLFGPDKVKSENLRIGSVFLRQNMDLLK